jgi:hypothetical protein
VNDRQIDGNKHAYVNTGTSVLRMRNGTLIVPISWIDGYNYDLMGDWFTYNYNVSVLRSDNEGLSWIESESMHVQNAPRVDRHLYFKNPITTLDEPTVVELSNGSLYCILRTEVIGEKGRHYYSISNDYGLSWSLCLPIENIFSFCTTPSLFRYSWNPSIVISAWINRTIDDAFYGVCTRRPLVVACSLDDCNTWNFTTILDDGSSNNSMNEPNIARSSDYILVGYRRYSEDDYYACVVAINNGISLLLPSDSVIRRFTLTFFVDRDSLAIAFGSKFNGYNWNPCVDVNLDGIVNILDAILFSGK